MRRITTAVMLLTALITAQSGLAARQPPRFENLAIEVAEGGQPAQLRYASDKETIEARARTMSVTYSGTTLTITMADGSATFVITGGQTVTAAFRRLDLSFDGGVLKNMRGDFSK